MSKPKLYTAFGKTLTIAQWAKEVKKNRVTIKSRLKKGMSLEEALTKPVEKFTAKKYLYKGEMLTLIQISKIVNIHKSTLISRVERQGLTLEEAINAPTPKLFYAFGKEQTIGEWCREFNIEDPTLIYNRVVRYGWSLEKALTTEIKVWKGFTNHPLYPSWSGMNRRTNDPNCKKYSQYGKLGVKVCDRWSSKLPNHQGFLNYVEDLEDAYYRAIEKYGEANPQLDKDKYGSGLLYSPKTCYYLTPSENALYKKNSISFTHNNKQYRGFYQFCADYQVDDSKGQAFRLYLKTGCLDEVIKVHATI